VPSICGEAVTDGVRFPVRPIERDIGIFILTIDPTLAIGPGQKYERPWKLGQEVRQLAYGMYTTWDPSLRSNFGVLARVLPRGDMRVHRLTR
jgi:hypothetical protein